MKGISNVVAVIMLLMISVALVSMLYVWSQSSFEIVTDEFDESEDMSEFAEFIVLENNGFDISVKNNGLSDLSGWVVYVDGKPSDFTIDKEILKPGEEAVITLVDVDVGTAEIQITSAEGASYMDSFTLG